MVESFLYLGNIVLGTVVLGQVIINYCFGDWLEEAKIHPKVDFQIKYLQPKGIISNLVEYLPKILWLLFYLVANQIVNIKNNCLGF